MNRSTITTILLALIVALLLGGLVILWGLIDTMRGVANAPSQVLGDAQTRVAQLEHPTPTIRPSPATIVVKIQNLSRLETSAYTIEKVITAEENQGPFGWLFGDRLLFVAHGQVIAGVDLGKMKPNDIMVSNDNRVTVTLPAAEVFVTTLDNQKSYVYERDTGVLRGAGANRRGGVLQLRDAGLGVAQHLARGACDAAHAVDQAPQDDQATQQQGDDQCEQNGGDRAAIHRPVFLFWVVAVP